MKSDVFPPGDFDSVRERILKKYYIDIDWPEFQELFNRFLNQWFAAHSYENVVRLQKNKNKFLKEERQRLDCTVKIVRDLWVYVFDGRSTKRKEEHIKSVVSAYKNAFKELQSLVEGDQKIIFQKELNEDLIESKRIGKRKNPRQVRQLVFDLSCLFPYGKKVGPQQKKDSISWKDVQMVLNVFLPPALVRNARRIYYDYLKETNHPLPSLQVKIIQKKRNKEKIFLQNFTNASLKQTLEDSTY